MEGEREGKHHTNQPWKKVSGSIYLQTLPQMELEVMRFLKERKSGQWDSSIALKDV